MEVTKKSVLTGIEHTREIPVTQEEIDCWSNGDLLIQDVFPHLSADDREFLMTGITPEEWDEAFDDSNEEEYILDD